eukprot:6017088-Amphidinium_carterae.1
MVEGDKWELYIPPELGYGTNVPDGSSIPVSSILIFEVELLKVRVAMTSCPKEAPGWENQDGTMLIAFGTDGNITNKSKGEETWTCPVTKLGFYVHLSVMSSTLESAVRTNSYLTGLF